MSPKKSFLGEFEQMVLLAILAGGNDTAGLTICDELDRRAGRSVSRSALYTTLDRMKKKRLVEWRIEAGDLARSGLPRRHFSATPAAIEALRESREALTRLWEGASSAIGDGGS